MYTNIPRKCVVFASILWQNPVCHFVEPNNYTPPNGGPYVPLVVFAEAKLLFRITTNYLQTHYLCFNCMNDSREEKGAIQRSKRFHKFGGYKLTLRMIIMWR